MKVVLVDRWRGRWLDRTGLALRIATVELVVLSALVTVTAVGGDPRLWIPLAVAAPLIALELWYDMRSRSRRLIPELAGAVGIGSVAAAIVLADGVAVKPGVGAIALAGVAWLTDLVPRASLLAIGTIGALAFIQVRGAPMRVTVIGVQQMVLGLFVVAATALAIA